MEEWEQPLPLLATASRCEPRRSHQQYGCLIDGVVWTGHPSRKHVVHQSWWEGSDARRKPQEGLSTSEGLQGNSVCASYLDTTQRWGASVWDSLLLFNVCITSLHLVRTQVPFLFFSFSAISTPPRPYPNSIPQICAPSTPPAAIGTARSRSTQESVVTQDQDVSLHQTSSRAEH